MSSGGSLDAQFRDTVLNLSHDLEGESVTYYSVGDPGSTIAGVAITATRGPTSDIFEPDSDEATGWFVAAAEVANPLEGDYLTDDGGDRWNVERTSPKTGGGFYLSCVKVKVN